MPKYSITLENAKLHISKGNSKIGKTIYNFSTLPGNQHYMLYVKGELLTDVPGTCTNLCAGCFGACYAVNSVKLHHNCTVRAWAENTLLLRNKPKELFNEIDLPDISIDDLYQCLDKIEIRPEGIDLDRLMITILQRYEGIKKLLNKQDN